MSNVMETPLTFGPEPRSSSWNASDELLKRALGGPRVLVLSHMFPNPHDPIAGTFVSEQLRALRNLGVRPIVMSPTPWAPGFLNFLPRVRKYSRIPRHATFEQFPVERPRVLTLPNGVDFAVSGLLAYLACRKAVASHLRRERIDLIHAHTIMPDGFAAVLLGREFDLPVVCTGHGSDVRIYPFKRRTVRAATIWALKRIDQLVVVSHELENKVGELMGGRSLTVGHNGADAELFHPIEKAMAQKELGLPRDKKFICFIGYLRPDKRLEVLLRALPRLAAKDVMLCVVGDGSLKKKLIEETKQLGIADDCIWAGKRPHDELPLWLGAADCMVLCSESEGLPTVIPEAMLVGTPVIATPVGGVPEVISHGHTGLLVPTNDPAALARAIDSLLQNEDFANDLSERARALALESFTWEVNALKTLAVYQAAMDGQNGSTTGSAFHSSLSHVA